MLRKAITIVPWIGMVIFGALYVMEVIDHGITVTYNDYSFKAYEADQESLVKYVKERGATATDKIAFENLGMIHENQYSDKYAPWIMTDLRFVKFDADGFIEKICLRSSGIDNPECPDNL